MASLCLWAGGVPPNSVADAVNAPRPLAPIVLETPPPPLLLSENCWVCNWLWELLVEDAWAAGALAGHELMLALLPVTKKLHQVSFVRLESNSFLQDALFNTNQGFDIANFFPLIAKPLI